MFDLSFDEMERIEEIVEIPITMELLTKMTHVRSYTVHRAIRVVHSEKMGIEMGIPYKMRMIVVSVFPGASPMQVVQKTQ